MRNILLAILIWIGMHACANAQNGIRINRWISGLSVPVDIGNCGDDRIFVIEKVGKIRIIKNNVLQARAFLDIGLKVRSTGGEQGLLGMAFHPRFKENGLIYVNYTDRSSQTMTVIEEYKISADSNRVDSLSGRVLLTIAQPYANHNGGCIKFGFDGYLYIGMGDGGSANDPQNNAQNKLSMLGKMLRIDVNSSGTYEIPATNPFVGKPAYAPEIWAIGMRNPWRFSFDRLTGDLWIGDVGQGSWEEVDFEPAGDAGGRNYGWRCYEGNANFNTSGCEPKNVFSFPIHEYFSDENINGCSVTGGYVYRGQRFPSLYGKYIYGDYCSGKIWSIHRGDSNRLINTLLYDHSNNSITTFGEDAAGNIYFADASLGAIFQILDTCTLKINLTTRDIQCAGNRDGNAMTDLGSIPEIKFLWSNGDTTSSVDSLGPGIYSVTVSTALCLATASFEIKDRKLDTACISPPFTATFCEGDSTTLVACDRPGIEKYIWYLDGMVIHGNEARLSVKQAGAYQLSIVDSLGCSSAISNIIQANVLPNPPKPEIWVSRDSIFATNGYQFYRWFRWSTLVSTTEVPYSWVNGADGPYRVQVVDSNGCASVWSDSVNVVVAGTNQPFKPIHLLIHSNPVIDELFFKSSEPIESWAVYDVQGALWKHNHISGLPNNWHSIRVQSLPKGIYCLRINCKKGVVNQLFLKE